MYAVVISLQILYGIVNGDRPTGIQGIFVSSLKCSTERGGKEHCCFKERHSYHTNRLWQVITGNFSVVALCFLLLVNIVFDFGCFTFKCLAVRSSSKAHSDFCSRFLCFQTAIQKNLNSEILCPQGYGDENARALRFSC